MSYEKLYILSFYIYIVSCLIVFSLVIKYSILYHRGEIEKGRKINIIAAVIFFISVSFYITFLILYYLNN